MLKKLTEDSGRGSGVQQINNKLRNIAAAINIPAPYWLCGGKADPGLSYCHQCAEKKVMEGCGEFIDGGWTQESDSCCHCEECGRLLDYILTDVGVEYELAHYRENPPALPIDPETAFHLIAINDATGEQGCAFLEEILFTKVNRGKYDEQNNTCHKTKNVEQKR